MVHEQLAAAVGHFRGWTGPCRILRTVLKGTPFVLIFAAILAIFVYGMIAAMLGTILPDLSERFQLTPAQNGTIAFSQAIGLIIASVGVGPLLDSEGDKIGLILGLAFIVVALFALPRSKGFRSIVFLLFLLGIGGGIVVTGANALVSAVSPDHRATALNLVNLFFGLGGLATPFISANIFKRNWLRLCYTVASLTVITLMVQVATSLPAPTAGAGFVLADAGPVLGRPLLFLLGAFLFLYVSCEVGVWNWLPRHLIAQGIPESRALNILSLGFALGLLVGRVGVSPILIHVPAVEVTLAASVAMAVTTFLMLVLSIKNVVTAMATEAARVTSTAGTWIRMGDTPTRPISRPRANPSDRIFSARDSGMPWAIRW